MNKCRYCKNWIRLSDNAFGDCDVLKRRMGRDDGCDQWSTKEKKSVSLSILIPIAILVGLIISGILKGIYNL